MTAKKIQRANSKKAPQTPGIDYLIQNKLNKLKNTRNDNNNSKSNGLSSLPSPPPSFFKPPIPQLPQLPLPPPPFFPPQPPLPPPTFNNFQLLPLPTNQQPTLFNTPPPPPPSPAPSLFGSQPITAIKKKEKEEQKIIDEIDTAIYEMLD